VQIAAAMRNWRGKHLLEGVALLLSKAHPSLNAHAQEIATAVLKHPLLATNWRLGDYVSKDELVRVLPCARKRRADAGHRSAWLPASEPDARR
jgi:hypothetical protein